MTGWVFMTFVNLFTWTPLSVYGFLKPTDSSAIATLSFATVVATTSHSVNLFYLLTSYLVANYVHKYVLSFWYWWFEYLAMIITFTYFQSTLIP
jgi:hypothetical protein